MSTRHCPACGGEVHAIASRCKHCKAALDAAPSPPRPAASAGRHARWPVIAIGVALLAIGMSLGVLIERWRSRGAEPAQARPRSLTPRAVPDRMPTPVIPEPGSTP